MWLTKFALRQPTAITLFFFAIALFGLIGYLSMGRNIIPNIAPPVVSVVAVYPGASPQEIERLVIKPIEDELQGVRHVDKILSTAHDGDGSIIVQFKQNTNLDGAATDVQHAVDAARINLPSDLVPPLVQKFDLSAAPILFEGVSSRSLSPVELSNLVENEIIPDLRGVSGVGQIQAAGEFKRQISVEPDPGKLSAVGATLNDVTNSLAQGNVSMPGGRFDQPFREATVGVRADITSAWQIERLPLPVPGGANTLLRVGDVAAVVDGYADHRLTQTVNGVDSVVLNISRDSDSDTVHTSTAVEAEFVQLAERYPQVEFQTLSTDADFTRVSINGVLQNLLEGIFLTALVLLFFLHVWRSALVVMIAIPASLLATFLVMWWLGFTVDVLSLMGLSLTIGILVDDSIVVIENITRHREMGKSPEDAAITGRSEIGGAAVAITLVDVVVFAPIAFMSGVMGQYMHEFGLVVVVATLFSLLVSFTLTPLLAARWAVLRKPRPLRDGPIAAFSDWFERVRRSYHDRFLPAALRRGWLVFIGCGVLVVASIIVGALVVPGEFQPNTEWGLAYINVQYPVGTPIAVTEAGTARLAAEIRKMDGVQYAMASVGRQSNGFSDVPGGNLATIEAVLFDDKRHNEHKVIAAAEKLTGLVPGAKISASSGQDAGQSPVSYVLSGDPDKLAVAREKMLALLRSNPYTRNVDSSDSAAGPRIDIQIDRDRAALLGVSPQAAAETARAAMGGVIATKVRQREGLVDAIVQYPAVVRNAENGMRLAKVRADNGVLVPLGDVATFDWTREPSTIARQDRNRIVRVYSDTIGNAPISKVTSQVDSALKAPGFLPSGVRVLPAGDTDLFASALRNIGLALGTSFLLIYMLLVLLYRGYLTPLVIMMSVPVALVGAFGILTGANVILNILTALHAPDGFLRYFQGQTFNLFSMLGIVMLMGLVAKNGILLVDYANTLCARGMAVTEAILESASIRFRPIVMTTAAMIFGMLPLALGITDGAEFRKSMGTVIIGGLISSLLLTLFLVPVVYVGVVGFVERRRARRLARRLALLQSDPALALEGTTD